MSATATEWLFAGWLFDGLGETGEADPSHEARSNDRADASAASASVVLPPTDVALIARIHDGDQAALEVVHATHWLGLVRYATRLTQSPDTASDLVQDVFLDLWVRRETWSVHVSIATYLYTAVRGRALRWLRHERVTRRHTSHVADLVFTGGVGQSESPEANAEIGHLYAIVNRVLETLPPRCREAFVLYREHGLDVADVARVMETSIGTVKVQLRRAVAALREALAPHLG